MLLMRNGSMIVLMATYFICALPDTLTRDAWLRLENYKQSPLQSGVPDALPRTPSFHTPCQKVGTRFDFRPNLGLTASSHLCYHYCVVIVRDPLASLHSPRADGPAAN